MRAPSREPAAALSRREQLAQWKQDKENQKNGKTNAGNAVKQPGRPVIRSALRPASASARAPATRAVLAPVLAPKPKTSATPRVPTPSPAPASALVPSPLTPSVTEMAEDPTLGSTGVEAPAQLEASRHSRASANSEWPGPELRRLSGLSHITEVPSPRFEARLEGSVRRALMFDSSKSQSPLCTLVPSPAPSPSLVHVLQEVGQTTVFRSADGSHDWEAEAHRLWAEVGELRQARDQDRKELRELQAVVERMCGLLDQCGIEAVDTETGAQEAAGTPADGLPTVPEIAGGLGWDFLGKPGRRRSVA